jgi:hypothetical protein
MRSVTFLTRTRGRLRLDWTDWLSYLYLFVGLFAMFAPILWLVMSSLKTESAISQFPPTFLPYSQKTVQVPGFEQKLPLFLTKVPQGGTREMAQVRRIGIMATMVDPKSPGDPIQVNINDRKPVNELVFSTSNYTDLFAKFSFGNYLFNSVFITVVATLLTLLINSMAAFALSKYQFRGQKAVFMLIIATLMIPPTIILGAGVSGDQQRRTAQQPVGGDFAGDCHTHRRVFAAPVHADDSRRTARSRAHGQRQRMAHLLEDHPAAVGPGAGRAGDFFGDVALERLLVALDRAVQI